MSQENLTEKEKKKLESLLGIELPSQEESIQEDREEEAVVEYLKKPETFIKKQCDYCKKTFKSNRRNIAFCSRKCRREYLWEQWGIKPKDPSSETDSKWLWEAWWNDEPLVIREDLLHVANTVLNVRQDRTIEKIHDLSDQGIDTSTDSIDDFISEMSIDLSDF